MNRSRIAIVACGLLLGASGARAQTGGDLAVNPVYQKDCAKCHGKTAAGRHFGGPSLVSEKVAATSPDDLRNMIANGKGRMPKFSGKLTPEEIVTLVRQIQALNRK